LNNTKNSAFRLAEQYKKMFNDENIPSGEIIQKQYNYEFEVHENRERLKVLVYFGKKGCKTIIQGNNETEFYNKAKSLILGDTLFEKEFNTRDNIEEPLSYIGTDEVGKGDFFGPLIIAGVLVDEGSKNKLLGAGVRDSKKISDNSIKKISLQIKKIIGSGYNIISINPARYNELYKKFMNINKLLGWGHAKALENILEKKFVEDAISDKFGDESLILNALQNHGKKVKLYQTHKAERFVAVAAASILARDKFNDWFELNSKKLNMLLPKGAAVKTIEIARKLKKDLGEDELQNYVKLNFKLINQVTKD
jgi:ribonuclease HIII